MFYGFGLFIDQDPALGPIVHHPVVSGLRQPDALASGHRHRIVAVANRTYATPR